jgi:hypothetical protein
MFKRSVPVTLPLSIRARSLRAGLVILSLAMAIPGAWASSRQPASQSAKPVPGVASSPGAPALSLWAWLQGLVGKVVHQPRGGATVQGGGCTDPNGGQCN